jgi:hypothetical protein
MKFLVTVPAPHVIFSKTVERWLKWTTEFEDDTGDKVQLALETTPNRMDVSISKCIELAKQRRPAWWVRLDADVWPESTFLEDFANVLECRDDMGFDVVCSPTVDKQGVVQAERPGKVDPDPIHPFECTWASGSLVFTSMKVLDRMKPVSMYKQIIGGEEQVMPLYLQTSYAKLQSSPLALYIAEQRPTTTEDYDFCERVRALGFKVCADPRILVRQMRPDTGVPSLRFGMKMGEPTEVVIQDAGVHPRAVVNVR